jgi:ribonuclease E
MRVPATAVEADLSNADGAIEVTTPRPEGAEPRERRPRQSRDRGPRTERTEQGERQERVAQVSQPVQQMTDDESQPRKSYFVTTAQAPAAQAATITESTADAMPETPVAVAATPVAQSKVVIPTAPTATAPVIEAPVVTAPQAAVGMPKLQPFELPLAELTQVAEKSGLSWVNSDAQKIAAVQAAIAAEPKAIHVPRERPAPVHIDEGPLILVETKRDLRAMALPFEEHTQA